MLNFKSRDESSVGASRYPGLKPIPQPGVEELNANVSHYIERERLVPLEGGPWVDPQQAITEAIEARYGYGKPMEEVYAAIDALQRFNLQLIRESIAVPDEAHLKAMDPADFKFRDLFASALLLDHREALGNAVTLCKQFLSRATSGLTARSLARIEYFQHLMEPRESTATEIICDKWLNNSSKIGLDPLLGVIASRDSAAFNKALQAEIERMLGSERSRLKKRDVQLRDVFRWDYLKVVAISMNYGLSLSCRDSALPVWDFPIAKRPEIRKLIQFEIPEPKEA